MKHFASIQREFLKYAIELLASGTKFEYWTYLAQLDHFRNNPYGKKPTAPKLVDEQMVAAKNASKTLKDVLRDTYFKMNATAKSIFAKQINDINDIIKDNSIVFKHKLRSKVLENKQKIEDNTTEYNKLWHMTHETNKRKEYFQTLKKLHKLQDFYDGYIKSLNRTNIVYDLRINEAKPDVLIQPTDNSLEIINANKVELKSAIDNWVNVVSPEGELPPIVSKKRLYNVLDIQ
jgi:hypothetical protein